METMRNVMKWGNSAGVLLPREWLGSQVRIEVVKKPANLKKDILELLEPYLEDILGVYLVGSYARGEQEEDSDVDVIAVSKSVKKEIISGKYHISIAPLESIKKSIEKYPILILPRVREAKAILNAPLLEELNQKKLTYGDFSEYFQETKRVIKINKKFIEMDKEDSQELESKEIIYSLILRLRGIYIIHKLLKNEKYSKKGFLKFLDSAGFGPDAVREVYRIYKQIRDEKPARQSIKIAVAEKLLALLTKEVERYK